MRPPKRNFDPGSEAYPADPLQQAMVSRDKDIMKLVRTALASGTARLAFQPVVLAKNAQQTAFYEGLIRVMDDGGRILPAALFMPLIEEMDLGREIDCTTLRLGFDMLRGNPALRLCGSAALRLCGSAALDERLGPVHR